MQMYSFSLYQINIIENKMHKNPKPVNDVTFFYNYVTCYGASLFNFAVLNIL